jgi:hypothetical protein
MLSREEILRLFDRLNGALAEAGVKGEVYLMGGAVMTLALRARPSTKDVDAVFAPSAEVRAAAEKVASQEGVGADWLNDGVKGYLSPSGRFTPYLDKPNLKVLTATPEYLLAMKCLSMRLGPEFHDEDDVRYLLRYLNIDDYDDAIEMIERFYPKDRFPPKAHYVLQELLGQEIEGPSL